MANGGQINYTINLNVNKQNLDTVQKSLNDIINKTKEFERAAPDYAEPFREAGEAAKELKNILNSSWNPQIGQLDLSKVEKELVKSYGSLTNFRTSLELIGPEGSKAFNQLASAIFGTQTPLKQTSALLEKMSVTFKNTIRYGISSSIFNNMTNSVSKAYNYVQKLDKSLNNIRIVSKQSADQMERFAKQANEASRTLGATTLDYTNASLIYYQQGLSTEEVKARTDVTLQLANVLKTTASDVSDYMTAIWNNFATGSENLEYYADVITALGAATASSSQEIADGLNKFAAIGKTVGLTYEYATAALATVVAQTRQSADTVGNAFKTLFARIQGLNLGETLDDGTTLNKYSEALMKVGIDIKDQQGQLKDMNDILDEMGSKWKTLNKDQQVALAQSVAGIRQYTQLVALMDNWDAFQDNLNIATTSEGTLSRQQEIYMDSVEAHLNKLQSRWEQFYESIFDEDTIKGLADALSTVIGIGNTFVTGLGGGMNTLVFGATALGNVFSTQVAQSLLRVETNAEKAKAALDTVSAQRRLYEEVYTKGVGADIGSIKELEKITEEIDLDRRLLKAKESVNEQEQKNIALLDQEYRENNKLIDSYEAIIAFQKRWKEENPDGKPKERFKKDNIQEEITKDIKGQASNLEASELLIADIERQEDVLWYFPMLAEEADRLTVQLEKLKKVETELINKQQEAEKQGKRLSPVDENLLKSNQELQRSYTRMISAVNALKEIREDEEKDFSDLEKDDQIEILNLAQRLNGAYKEQLNSLIDLRDLVGVVNDKKLESLHEEIKNLNVRNQKIREAKQEIVEQNELQQKITGELQTLFTLGSSVSAIFGAFKTFTNDSLSGWEKFGSIFTVIGTQGLMIMKTVDSLKANLPIIGAQLLKNMTEEEIILKIKEGQTAQLLAQVAKQSIYNTLKAIEAGIVAVIKALTSNIFSVSLLIIATVAGIVYAYNKWLSTEARLNAEIERTNKKLQEARDAYNDLKSTVSDYQQAYDGIKGLEEGTIAFYEAMLKANEAAQELINTWGLVAGKDYTIDTNGLITINEDVLKERLFLQQQNVYRAQGANFQAQGNKVQQSTVSGLPAVYDNLVKDVNAILKDNNAGMKINSQIAEAILKGNDSSVELNNMLLSISSSVENIDENSQDIGKDLNKIDITKAVAKYSTQYQELSAQLKSYQRQTVDSYIRGTQSQTQIAYYNTLVSDLQKSLQDYIYSNISNVPESISRYEPTRIQSVNTFTPGAGFQPVNPALELQNASINTKELKNWYAQNILKQNWQSNSELNKIIKDSGVSTKEMQAAKDQYEAAQAGFRYLRESKNAAAAYGLDENSQTYVATAKMSLMANGKNSDFDFSVLKEKELLELQRQIREEFNATITQDEETHTEYFDQTLYALNLYVQALKPVEDTEKRLNKDREKYNEILKQQASVLETSDKALKLYGQATIEADERLDGYNETTARTISEEYAFNKAFNNAVKTFDDNKDAFNEYVNALRTHKKVSYDVADATAEILDDLEKMGIVLSEDKLKDDNVIQNINNLLTGTEEEAEAAYKALEKISDGAVWDTWNENVLKADEWTQERVSNIKNALQSLGEGDIIPTDKFDEFEAYIRSAGMSYQELIDFLDRNHIKYEIDDIEEVTLEENPVPSQTQKFTHTISGKTNPYTGKKMKEPITWTETIVNTTTPYFTLKKKGDNKGNSGYSISPRNYNTNFTKSMSNSGSGSSGNNEPDKMDPIKTEIDRYHKINTQITKVDNNLSKLQNLQERFVGAKLLDNLNKQWNLLNTQIENYNKKLYIANDEQQELANKLIGKGVLFNEDGTISNYAEVIRTQEAYVNSLIDNYNSMSKDAQEGYKDTVEEAKKDFESFKTNLDRYDELISDFIPGLQQSILEAVEKQIEINVEKFNKEITITLDMNKATKDWNAWKKKIIDGIKEDDILGNARARLLDFDTYFTTGGTGDIQTGGRHLTDLLEELRRYDNGEDNVYGFNRTKALQDLNTYYEQVMTSLTEVQKLEEELYQDLLDEMDHVQEKFKEQIDAYAYLRDLINHDMKVIQLTLGEGAYGELIKFYDKQQENYQKQLDFQRQQRDFWEQRMKAAEEGTKEWESARDKWKEAVTEFNTILEESLSNATSKFENALNDIFDRLNNKITSGMGLDYVNTEWDLINKNADRYLDTINSAYGIRMLEKKYLDAMNNTNNISIQQKLKKIMDEQVKGLREKEKLTQYDIDRAMKLYDIELARIQLEEAQQNKSQMRLRRDSQGNYTYQYIGDPAAIQEAQDKLEDLYNSLYNFDKDRYKEILNDIYNIWNDYQQAMHEAALINDPIERAEKEKLIQEQYNELMMQAEEDYQTSRHNLQQSFFWDYVHLNQMTAEQVNQLTQEEKDMITNEMIPIWNNGVSSMAEMFSGPDGFAEQTINSWNEIKEAENQYALDVEKLEEISQTTFESIANGEDHAIELASELVKSNEELIDSYGEELDAVKAIYNELLNLRDAYKEVEEAAKAAAEAGYRYRHAEELEQIEAAKKAAEEEALRTAAEAESYINPTPETPATTSNSSSNSNGSGGDGVPRVGDLVNFDSGIYTADSYGGGSSGSLGRGGKVKITIVQDDGRPRPIHIATTGGGALGWVSKGQISGYDTGGYTGNWSGGGKIGLLHQKELVLNAQDTENMLNTVAIMRSLAYSLGSSMLAKIAGASAQGYSGGGSGSNGLEQNVHIDAQFPNVRDSREIEEALNNLVNAAAQRAFER